MNWLRRLFRQKAANPSVSFGVEGGKRVFCTVDWPDHDDAAAKVAVAHALSAMIGLINSGELLPMAMQAVATCGRLKGDPHLSEFVLRCVLERSGKKGPPGGPLVAPDEVFGGGQSKEDGE